MTMFIQGLNSIINLLINKIIKVPSSALESSEWSNLNDSLPVRLGGNFKLDNFTSNPRNKDLINKNVELIERHSRLASTVKTIYQVHDEVPDFHKYGDANTVSIKNYYGVNRDFLPRTMNIVEINNEKSSDSDIILSAHKDQHIVDSSIDEGSQAQRLQNNFESLIPQAIKGKNEYINHADNRRVSQEIHETERDLLHMMNPRNSIIHRDAVDEEEDKKENQCTPNLHNYENDRYISEDEEEVDGRFNNPETSFVTVKGNKLMSLVNKIHGLVTPNKHQKTQRNLRSSCMANKIERLNSPHASEVANYTRSFYLVQGEYPTENIILTQKAGNIDVKLPTGIRWLRKFRRRY